MDATISMYIAQGIHGIAYGLILFLIASGLNIIFGMMGILNMAHGSFFMLAAYFCYQVVATTGSFVLSLLVAPVIVAVFGLIMERYMLRRFSNLGGMSYLLQLILTLGVGMVILSGIKFHWGTQSLQVAIPSLLDGVVSFAGMEYPVYRLFVIILSIAVLILMGLVLYKTRLGKIVQAAVSDGEMVSALGINISVVYMLVFGIGTWLAGVAGVAVAPILTVFPGLADQVGTDAFIVVVTGGFGSLMGAFIVSLIFGLLNSYGIQFISSLAPVLVMAFMAIVLVIRPNGLMGVDES